MDPEQLLHEIAALPEDWHGAGTVSQRVLRALHRQLSPEGVAHSMETGTGRTTLLLSHLSRAHTVFTKDDAGGGDSLDRVRESALLEPSTVTFEIGPTQRTLLQHHFEEPLHLAYLDGPHAYPFPDLEYWAVYPHVAEGGLLVVDDVQIPTIHHLFRFLDADDMWDLVEVVDNTAFFRRTSSPALDPYGEGWWLQGANRHPVLSHLPVRERIAARAAARLPEGLRTRLRERLGRS